MWVNTSPNKVFDSVWIPGLIRMLGWHWHQISGRMCCTNIAITINYTHTDLLTIHPPNTRTLHTNRIIKKQITHSSRSTALPTPRTAQPWISRRINHRCWPSSCLVRLYWLHKRDWLMRSMQHLADGPPGAVKSTGHPRMSSADSFSPEVKASVGRRGSEARIEILEFPGTE